jgi:hypothetical protein
MVRSLQENCCFEAVLEDICGGFELPQFFIASVEQRLEILASRHNMATVFQTAIQTVVTY